MKKLYEVIKTINNRKILASLFIEANETLDGKDTIVITTHEGLHIYAQLNSELKFTFSDSVLSPTIEIRTADISVNNILRCIESIKGGI